MVGESTKNWKRSGKGFGKICQTEPETESVRKEMNGPGKLLGYRALHRKIREVHGQNVPRNLEPMMTEVDSSFLKERGVSKQKRARKGVFSSKVILNRKGPSSYTLSN